MNAYDKIYILSTNVPKLRHALCKYERAYAKNAYKNGYKAYIRTVDYQIVTPHTYKAFKYVFKTLVKSDMVVEINYNKA